LPATALPTAAQAYRLPAKATAIPAAKV